MGLADAVVERQELFVCRVRVAELARDQRVQRTCRGRNVEGSRQGNVQGGLVFADGEEDGEAGNFLEDGWVGTDGDFVLQAGGKFVEDESCDREAFALDGLDGEEGVVDGPQAVVDDDDDREAEVGSEVGGVVVFKDGDAPAANAFDEHGGMAGFQRLVGGQNVGGLDQPLLDGGCSQRCGRRAEPHRIDGIEAEVKALAGGFPERPNVIALPAADGLETNGIITGTPEGLQDQAGRVGLANTCVCASDKPVHLEFGLPLSEACNS